MNIVHKEKLVHCIHFDDDVVFHDCISMFLTEDLQTHSEKWHHTISCNLVEPSLEIKFLIGNKTSNQK